MLVHTAIGVLFGILCIYRVRRIRRDRRWKAESTWDWGARCSQCGDGFRVPYTAWRISVAVTHPMYDPLVCRKCGGSGYDPLVCRKCGGSGLRHWIRNIGRRKPDGTWEWQFHDPPAPTDPTAESRQP